MLRLYLGQLVGWLVDVTIQKPCCECCNLPKPPTPPKGLVSWYLEHHRSEPNKELMIAAHAYRQKAYDFVMQRLAYPKSPREKGVDRDVVFGRTFALYDYEIPLQTGNVIQVEIFGGGGAANSSRTPQSDIDASIYFGPECEIPDEVEFEKKFLTAINDLEFPLPLRGTTET